MNKIFWNHGLGDCAQFAAVLKVYKDHGFDIPVHYAKDKACMFEAVGVEWCESEGTVNHDWSYCPGFNDPVPDVDWSGSKVGLNMSREPMPDIGNYWDELCNVNLEGSLDRFVDKANVSGAEKFLRDLPRPIILLHTTGTNYVGKNIPDDQIDSLYKGLLTLGSIVILDWDLRVPELPHGRVRHSKKDWGHISLLDLYAIMEKADLLIGVDSGPFHFSAFSRIPTLGIFSHHYPSCVALPRAKTVCMVSSNNERNRERPPHNNVNIARRQRWNIVEYPGGIATVAHIVTHAQRILEGSRYGLPIGRDVMMQQWIRDWCLQGPVWECPHADRNVTLDFLFREIYKRYKDPVIVETGCIRQKEDWTAGYSSYLFGASNRPFLSIDNSQEHIEFAKKTAWGGEFVCSDSVLWLEGCEEGIDLLYLDSWDADVPGHAEHGLAEIKAAYNKLHNNSIVVYDDTIWNQGWKGKGALGVPFLLDQGWKIIASGYQVVLGSQCEAN